MKVKQTPISQAVFIALLGIGGAATAQQAPAPADAQQLETVVVTGIRASQEKSLSVKRNADTHVDVISAEDIGKMPDKNVADSLARIPGVTILNSPSGGSGGFDERDRVGLRGTNPSLTQTLLDGHAVANGDWFVLDQTGAGVGRSVSFSLLPSELVSRVEVHKNAQASDTEGGTAGAVNIITRKPLDFAKSLTFEAGLGMVYADLPKKSDPQLSALLAWKNDAKTFGILVQAFDEKRHLRRDGVETIALDSQPHAYQAIGAAESAVTAQVPGLTGVLYPNLMGSAYFTQDRERKGGVVSAQIKPTNDVDVTLTAFSSTMDANNYNRNYMLAVPWALQATGANAPTLKSYTVNPASNILTSADLTYATPTKVGVYDLISRKASAATNFANLEGSWRVNDKLKLAGKAGTSTGTGKTLSQDVFEGDVYGTAAGWKQNGIGQAPSFYMNVVANPNAKANADEPYSLDWIFGDQNVVVKDKDTWAQVDAEYSIDSGMLRSLQFGLRSSQHKRYTDGPIIGQGPNWGTWPEALKTADYTQSYPSNFGSGLGQGFPTNIMFPTAETLAAYDATHANRPLSRRQPTHEYSVKETTTAAYAQGNLEGSGWSGNVGLRLVHTKTSTLVWVPTSDTTLPGYAASAFAAVGPAWTDPSGYYQTFHDRSYTDALPSASIRIDVTKDVVARLALSRTVTRPDYTALSAAQLLNGYHDATGQTVGTGTTGNPDLDPIRSTNFDANVEWYFAPRAFVSVGAFHMNLNSYIIDGTKRATLTTDLITPGPNGQPGQQGKPGNAMITAPFDLTTQINKAASVTGLEFAFETPVAGNFGVSANYTLADGHDESGHVLRGSVKNSANLGGFFENDQFSARLNYGYSSDNYLGRDRGTDYYQVGGGVLSASLGYKLNDHFAVSLDAQNLNDPILKYYGDNKSEPRAVYRNGRQFYLTARVKY
ncbi:TonB-dependent receptor [Roseateles saccharophilus]|uniref:Iron complex outermembrane receptor protein n=1 Tax=Roseateles saccharophilus TaxID=304 RepID=A0A4V2VNZ7_ROSSA|nr:TonB-dependent receptor [Roseateles saccharophilus]MDG0835426.1 TonB-dependent receptor [Roseateles saccharophilus]TCU86315.1 iron complex outermembrane receptor protein [Roseateles saccharophilus]